MCSKFIQNSLYFLLALLLGFATWARFYRLSEVGVAGADVFFYWQTAFNWMNGNFELTEHFRPFIYWIHSSLFKITGPNDWIVRYFNSISNLLVGVLVIIAGRLMNKSWLMSLCAG